MIFVVFRPAYFFKLYLDIRNRVLKRSHIFVVWGKWDTDEAIYVKLFHVAVIDIFTVFTQVHVFWGLSNFCPSASLSLINTQNYNS